MASTIHRVAPPPQHERPGKRALRPPRRRARTLGGALLVTLFSAVLPGVGFLWSGRRSLGFLVLPPALTLIGLAAWYGVRNPRAVLDLAFDPTRLQIAAVALGAGLVVWALIVLTTYFMVRPLPSRVLHTLVGTVFVGLLCAAVAAPVVVGARYAMVQADLVTTVFKNNTSATAPKNVTVEDPWAGRDQVNVLLLGGDGGVHREGVRTDTMILLSLNTRTGRTIMFSLPRNMMNAQFPVDSPLHDLYPSGFAGYGDPGSWMLNAVYRMVPMLHPGILGKSDNEGADALKLAVQGSLGVPVDYYVLVNLRGFRQIVDAMGGVTVNISSPIPVGGNTDLGILPDRYLQPGPNQRLDGMDALWYSRGRYGSDDYQRMERQRCMIDAIIDEARPLNLLRRYQALAEAGKQIIRTDIPSKLLPAFVDLAMQIKNASVTSVVFRSSEAFFPGDPDFAWMRQKVRTALRPPPDKPRDRAESRPTPTRSPSPGAPTEEADPGTAVEATDICGYHPETP